MLLESLEKDEKQWDDLISSGSIPRWRVWMAKSLSANFVQYLGTVNFGHDPDRKPGLRSARIEWWTRADICWFKTIQGTVGKCTQFELNLRRNCQPVKTITNEFINVAETWMLIYHSCSHIDNDLQSSWLRLWESGVKWIASKFCIRWASRLHCAGLHDPISGVQSKVVE